MGRICALLVVTAAAMLAGAVPATAQGQDGTVVSVLYGPEPALPSELLLQVVRADAELFVAVNPTPIPLVVLAPDGAEFLRISAAGVETNAAAPFTYQSRARPGVGTAALPPGVAVGAPPRWTLVTRDVSWRWYDPRLRPAGVLAPVGGRSDVRQVLAPWSVPMRIGDTPVEVRGALERHPRVGSFQTLLDPAPDRLTALVTTDTPPNVILQTPDGVPVTVLGVDGEPFLRRASDGGWEANLGSRSYQQNLLDTNKPVPAGGGWRRYAGPGSVSWSDERLRYPVEVDPAAVVSSGFTDIARWEIPLVIDDRSVALTGTTRFTPRPGAGTAASGPPWALLGLGGAVALLAAALTAFTVWNRRLAHTPDTPTDVEPDVESEGDSVR